MISMTGSFHVDSTFRILFLFSKFCDEICFYVHIIAFRPNIGKLLFPCFILFNTFSPILPLSCYYILFYPIMHTTKVALNIFTNTREYYRRQIKVLLHVPSLNSPQISNSLRMQRQGLEVCFNKNIGLTVFPMMHKYTIE